MKKSIVLTLAIVVLITSVLASCASNKNDDTTTANNLENYDTEFGFEINENGEEVAVEYGVDKDGNTVAYELDKDGNRKKDNKGEYVTVKTTYVQTTAPSTAAGKNDSSQEEDTKRLTTTTTQKPTATTAKDVPLTDSKETTRFDGTETVPKTSAGGKEVSFSEKDQEIITSMLEVPYLYEASYENSDGVPINIACRAAVWMAEQEGGTKTTYPSSPVVLNLFKYFGQTVVNFKTQCNEYKGDAPITYNKSNDTFTISEYTGKKQSVTITKIEDLGDNNFYKITGDVSGCSKKKVIAIVQKNNLDKSLHFSIKALKWS